MNLLIAFSALLTLHSSVSSASVSSVSVSSVSVSPCPSVCVCRGTVTDCSNKNLTEIPTDVSNKTEWFYLHDNRLSHVTNASLSKLTKLRYLTLFRNQIESIHPKAFQAQKRVIKLYLSYNYLTSLPSGLFASLSKLDGLFISNNRLESLPEDILNPLPKLKTLYLFDNKLKSLPQRLFQKQKKLRRVQLTNNPLQCNEQTAASLSAVQSQLDPVWGLLGTCYASNRRKVELKHLQSIMSRIRPNKIVVNPVEKESIP